MVLKVLMIRHAQSENNIVQATVHVKMKQGLLSAADAQVTRLWFIAFREFDLIFLYRQNGWLIDMKTLDYQQKG